tara:strand:+ start:487 stop:1020 length:534 start_codon:yes stop_codon:yes gene_type:complete
MTCQQLTAFGDDSALPWQLRASIKRLDQGILALDYELLAPSDQLIWPGATASPERRDELWQSTCLELFIAQPNEPRYWEINLSPSGDWNVYRLDGYRQVLQAEPSIQHIKLSSQSAADRHQLDARVELPRVLRQVALLEASLCAVLQHANGSNSYWALCHPGSEADFHARAGFVLEV